MKNYTHGIFMFLLSCFVLLAFQLKEKPNPAPNYTSESAWIALPWRHDMGDSLPPNCVLKDNQGEAAADVFYVHPTLYLSGREWNANLADKKLNKKCDNCVMQQGALFNAAGKVYAPRYRQAVLRAFYNDDPERMAALDFAYADVKAAFEYYLKNWNKGRPIIIAGHSQGARHTARLLHEFFEGKPLKKQLVAAYLIGFNFSKNEYTDIPLGDSASQTGCFVVWNSVGWGLEPTGNYARYKNAACVNPLTWKTTSETAPKSLNNGSVPYSFDRTDKNNCDATIHNGLLWVRPANKKGYFHFGKNYHVSDMGLFYANIRENAVLRVDAYLKTNK